jgi:hypothetical protein
VSGAHAQDDGRLTTSVGASELPNLPLEDALQLVHLYAERGSPKYGKAALRWLERCLTEGSPRLQQFAEVARDHARREPNARPRALARWTDGDEAGGACHVVVRLPSRTATMLVPKPVFRV